ncbi:MAG: AIR synthase-related protein, partial [Nitriliruptorales bacterium]|nr:AIR synthase-related protein [Nitriliruptorales bacterium]
LLASHRRPRPQLLAAAPLVVGGAKAAIEVSDGLGRDLGNIAESSGVGIRVDAARLPVHPALVDAADVLGQDPIDWVVAGGDDYAIVATVAPERLARLEASLETSGLRPAIIGEVVDGRGVTLVDEDGQHRDLTQDGWEHP